MFFLDLESATETQSSEPFILARTQSSIMPTTISISQPLFSTKTSTIASPVLSVPNGINQVSPILMTSTNHGSKTIQTVLPDIVPGTTQPVMVGGTRSVPGAYVLYNHNLFVGVSSDLTSSGVDTSVVQTATSVPISGNKKFVKTRPNVIPSNLLPPGIDPNQPLSPEFIATHMIKSSSSKSSDAKASLLTSPSITSKTCTVTVDSMGRAILSQVSPIAVPQSPLSSEITSLTQTPHLAMSPTDITATNILAPISPTSLIPQLPKSRDKVPAWRSKF